MSKNFTDFLFKKYQKEVLSHLRSNYDTDYTVNKLVKNSSGSYTAVKNFLDSLREYSIVSFKKKGNYNLVSYNPENPYEEIIREIFRAESEHLEREAEKFAKKIKKQDIWSKIHSVLLFGSVARGTPDKDSDIDILVLVKEQKDKREVEEISRDIASRNLWGSEIVPIAESMEEFKENYRNNSRFEQNVYRDHIVLTGEELDGEI